jgi:uncharacterized protein YndB with AHSA1/START domain
MTAFSLHRTSPARPSQVWDVLTDFAGHEQWIPLTTMRVDPGEPRVGWGWAGVSGLGPLGFADAMVLTRWEPPAETGDEPGEPGDEPGRGRFSMLKVGRVLDGWADVHLEPAAGGGTAVTWSEDISLRPRALRRLTQPLVDRAARAMFASALDAMLGEAARRADRAIA